MVEKVQMLLCTAKGNKSFIFLRLQKVVRRQPLDVRHPGSDKGPLRVCGKVRDNSDF